MARITAFIRLGMSPALLKEARAEAKFQGISVNQFIRAALLEQINRLDKQRVDESYRDNKPIRTRKA